MSAYARDPRVRFNGDGTATLPDPVNGGWTVRREHGHWVAVHPEQGHLHDLTCADYPARYGSRDEVFEHLLGPATVPV